MTIIDVVKQLLLSPLSFWACFPPSRSGQIQQFRPQALVVIGGGISEHTGEYDAPFTVNAGT